MPRDEGERSSAAPTSLSIVTRNGAPATPETGALKDAAAALGAARCQAEWLRGYGPTSWDQYDLWASPLGRRAKEIYYAGSRRGLPCVAPFAAIDTFAPRLRALLWHRSRFPIADAHWAMGFFNLARLEPGARWAERGVEFLQSLSAARCPSFEHACWGYPFDWETCFGTFVAGTPLITTTPYAYEAFDSGYAATGDDRYLELMESAGRFAFHDITDAEVVRGVFASSYTPSDSRRVVNASAYRAFLLAAAGSRFGHDDWLAAAAETSPSCCRANCPTARGTTPWMAKIGSSTTSTPVSCSRTW